MGHVLRDDVEHGYSLPLVFAYFQRYSCRPLRRPQLVQAEPARIRRYDTGGFAAGIAYDMRDLSSPDEPVLLGQGNGAKLLARQPFAGERSRQQKLDLLPLCIPDLKFPLCVDGV